jgi:hypothetical protein
MATCEGFPGACLYLVEVSGWDCRKNFFVEKCDLAWSEESGKQVELSRKLQENAVLFVRLLQTEDGERSHPLVYEAEWLGRAPNGMQQFRLKAVVPLQRQQEVAAL